MFAVPGVEVQNFQSDAALSVSVPFGSRQSEPCTVLLSAVAAGSAVPSTKDFMPKRLMTPTVMDHS